MKTRFLRDRGRWINPQWMALTSSRGFESPGLKAFMRASVLVSDLCVFFPAVLAFFLTLKNRSPTLSPLSAAFLVLVSPSLLLIDYGHFQYNGVMLGLAIWAVVFIARDRIYLGAFFFCLSIFFKQMALYYALPFFFYLLGHAFRSQPLSKGSVFFSFFFLLFPFSFLFFVFFIFPFLFV